LVEQLIRNQQVRGSSPRAGSNRIKVYSSHMGEVNSIRRRNTICDRRRHGCALVQDVVE
jgi:hypothetical protein